MRLNLGCGPDVRPGYRNIDLYSSDPNVEKIDLSSLPWPFKNDSAEEILMLDFLEHFPYRKTGLILQEVWRVLKPEGFVDIQVPDFEECARAVLSETSCLCNRCGHRVNSHENKCSSCGQTRENIAVAAVKRLYGGQDFAGNYHYTAFSKTILRGLLEEHGFENFVFMERNQNGETYQQNWNFYVRAHKRGDLW